MEVRTVTFFVVQAMACLYAVRRGGQPERLTAVAMAVAAIATASLPFNPVTSFRSPEWRELQIDVAFLMCGTVLMCRADRFWPAWIVALQFLAVSAHVLRIVEPSILPRVYSAAIGWMAYPMIALLVIGVRRHQQRTRITAERDWSPLRW